MSKLNFSEHGHVAYQIKGNHEFGNMVANILPTDPPRPLGSKCSNATFQDMVMLHIKLKEITNAALCSNFCPQTPPTTLPIKGAGNKRSDKLFQNLVMLHIKLNGITNAATW